MAEFNLYPNRNELAPKNYNATLVKGNFLSCHVFDKFIFIHTVEHHSTETPEWRKGPMGPRTLCNACGLIWAKLARKKNQSSDRFKVSKDSAPSCKLEYDSTPVAITDPEPKRQQAEPMAYSNSSSQGSLEAIASGPPSRKNSDSDLLQYSLVETDLCRQNTHHSRTGGSRGDKFKLSFLLD